MSIAEIRSRDYAVCIEVYMNKSMGTIIFERRKALGMTQAELAQRMNVTDKAVSKWERNISCPDTASLARLAETLNISLDELLSGQAAVSRQKWEMLPLVCNAVSLAMGVAVTVLCVLSRLDLLRENSSLGTEDMLLLCGIGILLLSYNNIRNLGSD